MNPVISRPSYPQGNRGYSVGPVHLGNEKINSRPPVERLCTDMVPPSVITVLLTIGRPSPVPPCLRERPVSMR